jgi:hypothetical protein
MAGEEVIPNKDVGHPENWDRNPAEGRDASMSELLFEETHAMSSHVCSRHRAGATRILAGMAILAVLSLATPSASAQVSLSWEATDESTGSTTAADIASGVSSGSINLANFTFSLTATVPGGPPGINTLTLTTNATVINNSSTTDTLDLVVTGMGFIGTGVTGANFNVAANVTASQNRSASDTTSATSSADNVYLGSLVGTPNAGFGAQAYTFTGTPPGTGPNITFMLTGASFSITQELVITLGGGDSVNFPITTNVTPTPEPSSMAIAGMGALGLIGYSLRGRKTLG